MPNAHRLKPKPVSQGALTEERVHMLEQHATLEALGHRDWIYCNCEVGRKLQQLRRR